MIDVIEDFQSMTTFKRNSNGLIKRMKRPDARLCSP